MAYCPFSLVKEVVKERKVGKSGQVVEEKESPTYHLLECLREKCEVFDLGAQKCSLPFLANRLQSLEDVEAKTRQATSDLNEATSSLLADLLESSSGILKETKDSRAMIHQLVEAPPAQAGGLSPEALADLKSAAEALRGSKDTFAELSQRLEELLTRPDETRTLSEGFGTLAKNLEESRASVVESALETRILVEKITQGLAEFKEAAGTAGLDKETKSTLNEIRDTLQGTRQSMDHIFSLLPEVLKESQMPLASFAESNQASLSELQKALSGYQEAIQQAVESFSKSAKQSQEALLESYVEEAGGLKESLTTALTSLGEAQKVQTEGLSEILTAQSKSLEKSLEKLPQRLREEQEPLFSKFADENKSAFDLFVQGATETTLSLTQLRQISEKSNEILSTLTASSSDAAERTIEGLGRLREAVKVANEEAVQKNSELFSIYLKDLANGIQSSQAETSQTLAQKLDALGENLKQNQDSLSSLLLESAGKSQTALEALAESNAGTLEALKDVKAALVESQRESTVGIAEVLKRLQADSRSAQDQSVSTLTAALSEGTAQQIAHASKLRDETSQHQENLFAALAGSVGDTLRQNAAEVSQSLEKTAKEANEKRSQIAASLAENRQALEKLLSAAEESNRPLASSLQDIAGKLDAFLSSLDRQSVLQSDSFETLGQRVTGIREEERRGTEALLAALSENQKAQAQNMDSLRTALEQSMAQTREFLAGPQEREAKFQNISEEIAASAKALSSFLETQRQMHEQESRKLKGEEARLHNDRGVSLYYQQAYGAAEMEFKRALELNPDMVEAFNNLALTLTEAGKHEDAAVCFQRAIELAPDFAEALNNLGCLYQQMGEHAKAVETFSQALTKRQDYASAYANLGTAYYALNKLDEATKAWDKALSLDPTNEKLKKKLQKIRGM